MKLRQQEIGACLGSKFSKPAKSAGPNLSGEAAGARGQKLRRLTIPAAARRVCALRLPCRRRADLGHHAGEVAVIRDRREALVQDDPIALCCAAVPRLTPVWDTRCIPTQGHPQVRTAPCSPTSHMSGETTWSRERLPGAALVPGRTKRSSLRKTIDRAGGNW